MSLVAWCQSALLLAAALAALFWLGAGFVLYAGVRRLRGLEEIEPLPDDALPPVSIVVAARDEAARVETAVRSLLAIDYPRLSLVAVDDRSTDGTGAILDRVAAEDPRLRVLHLTDLPPGWIGKCHALARGEAASGGEWILFTDGDVVLAPDALRLAISHGIREGADHVAVGIDVETEGLGEAAFVAHFLTMFFVTQRPWGAGDPRTKDHIGIGAFNLVRRDAYERAGGHEALRMELLDDLGLGLLLKRSGGRTLFALPDGRVRTRWHAGVIGLVRGVEKNAFPAMGFRVGFTVFAVTMQLVTALAPVLALFAAGPWTRALGIAAWSGVFLVYAVTAGYARIRVWQALLMPVGAILFAFAIVRSAFVTLARGGVTWRGTFYPIGDLRRGRVRWSSEKKIPPRSS
ncbi:MAG: glycosyltransferase [Hyphomicrobiales bacterium]